MQGKRPDTARRYKLLLLTIFSVWLACTIIAPFTIPANSVNDLTGKATQIDNEKVWDKMNPFAGPVYFLGDLFCAEITDHSFFLNGNQMPFCARCTAIFVGLVVGALIGLYFGPRFNMMMLAIGLLPIVMDGGLQLVSSYQSTNLVRVMTGLVAGTAISLYLSGRFDMWFSGYPEQEKKVVRS